MSSLWTCRTIRLFSRCCPMVLQRYVFTRRKALKDLSELAFVAGMTIISWTTRLTWLNKLRYYFTYQRRLCKGCKHLVFFEAFNTSVAEQAVPGSIIMQIWPPLKPRSLTWTPHYLLLAEWLGENKIICWVVRGWWKIRKSKTRTGSTSTTCRSITRRSHIASSVDNSCKISEHARS